MTILTIRTDNPQAELGLYHGTEQVAYCTWEAHRQLAETIHQKIQTLLADNSASLKDLEGIVVYQGPGSFTGLRIGISVANALAVSLAIPITGQTGDWWVSEGCAALADGKAPAPIVPEYGAPVHITQQRK